VRRIRTVYGERRDAMLRALDRHAPLGVRWTRPWGGLFLWATLPAGFDTLKLLDEAIAERVAFVPGAAFYPCGGGERTMRLNFSYAAPNVIEEGIKRLSKVIERKL
jgi:2-aminoadipate transaminase